MAVTARFLIDTSAAARMSNPDVGRRVSPLIQGGVVATTASLDAEALYSARGPAEYEQLWNDRRLAYEYLPTNDEHWQTALDAQRDLARTGRHRAAAPLFVGADGERISRGTLQYRRRSPGSMP